MAKKVYVGVDGTARRVKKGYVGVETFTPRALPEGYTQIAYIESSGTQYIDTDFAPNQDTRTVIDAEVLSANTGNNHHIGTVYTGGVYCTMRLRSDRSGYAARYGGQALTNVANSGEVFGRHVFDRNKNNVQVDAATATSFTYAAWSLSQTLPLFCAKGDNGKIDGYTSMKLYSCQIYDNGTLVRDFVPCTNASGAAGLYDLAGGAFYTNAGTGTFLTGSTYGSIARKIRRGYVGVGGVARPFWSGGELVYWGQATPLSVARHSGAAVSIGNYGLFVSGNNGIYTADAYDKNLVLLTPGNTECRHNSGSGIAVGNYALFFGSSVNDTTVDVYNASLVHTTVDCGLSYRQYNAAARVGNYAIFAGGLSERTNSSSSHVYAATDVVAFNDSLVRTTASSLPDAQLHLAGVSTGSYALFGGGKASARSTAANVLTMTAYDHNLVQTAPTSLTSANEPNAASVGSYGIVWTSANFEVYDDTLTKIGVFSPISSYYSGMRDNAATTLDNYAIFAGGSDGSSFTSAVLTYDENLTAGQEPSLSNTNYMLMACFVGNYALFGGGFDNANHRNYDTVDVFTIA